MEGSEFGGKEEAVCASRVGTGSGPKWLTPWAVARRFSRGPLLEAWSLQSGPSVGRRSPEFPASIPNSGTPTPGAS